MSDIKLAHIINPIGLKESDSFYPIQEITLQSIINARNFSSKHSVELLTTQYEEDKAVIPNAFKILENLSESVRDITGDDSLKKLPLIDEIIKIALKHSDADYIVYTNMDIGLMPFFYDFIINQIQENDFDAMLITRRRIGLQYSSKSQLSAIYADKGKPHPGYDTFVIHRNIAAQLVLDKICVGVPFLEVSLLHNLVAFAKNMKVFEQEHLTFHIGMEVMPPVNAKLYQYNRNIYEKKIFPQIKPCLSKEKFPYSNQSFFKRWMIWGLNPCYRTALLLEMEQMSFFRKVKFLLDELRWKVIQGD